LEYLQKRNLVKQYKKAKNYILLWYFQSVDLKLREPKEDQIYYFRINKQFRVHGFIENNQFYVLEIDNHQK
jgi:plasmid maintenance system killer protein